MNNSIIETLKEHNLLCEKSLNSIQDKGNIFDLINKNADLNSPEIKKLIQDIASDYGIKFSPEITYDHIPQNILQKLPFDYLRNNNIAPFSINENTIHIALQSVNQRDKIDYLRIILSGLNFETHLSYPQNIKNVLNEIFKQKDFIDYELVDQQKTHIPKKNSTNKNALDKTTTQKTQVTELTNNIIAEAVRINATDIHLHPEINDFKLFYRINGILHCLKTIPKNIYNELISRLKIISSLDITKKNTPQDGSFSFEFTEGNFVDVRISFIPTTNDERVVLRILNHDKIFRPLETLGMNNVEKNTITKNIKRLGGMLLVNGPTGSGKTTTLYAALDIINNGKKNIITIEDPVEYNLVGVGQMQVSDKLQFKTALRSVLRQDPDVIMVGEIRDEETAQIAIRSALTGHLVLSTLHTNNSIQAVIRLIEIGIAPYLITSAVTLSISQRLIRILCNECKKTATINTEILEQYPDIFTEGNNNIYEAHGCKNCFNTGYKSREAIYEMLEITPEIKDMIHQQKSENDIYQHLIKTTDFLPLHHNALLKIKEGKTSIEEYLRILN